MLFGNCNSSLCLYSSFNSTLCHPFFVLPFLVCPYIMICLFIFEPATSRALDLDLLRIPFLIYSTRRPSFGFHPYRALYHRKRIHIEVVLPCFILGFLFPFVIAYGCWLARLKTARIVSRSRRSGLATLWRALVWRHGKQLWGSGVVSLSMKCVFVFVVNLVVNYPTPIPHPYLIWVRQSERMTMMRVHENQCILLGLVERLIQKDIWFEDWMYCTQASVSGLLLLAL